MANIIIGIADLGVARPPDTLTTLGLGSCVGLVIYDPSNKISGMAHIMLPSSAINTETRNKAKFADTAFEWLMKILIENGAHRSRLIAKMAGGAHMFTSSVNNDSMKVGQRNVDTCHELLRKNFIPIISEDTGGNLGRTIDFNCQTNMLTIRTAWPKIEKQI